MTQTLSTIIFFAVFIELLICLSLYLFVTVRDFLRTRKIPNKRGNVEELHVHEDEDTPPLKS